MHGPAKVEVGLDSADFRLLQKHLVDPGSLVTVLKTGNTPSGVRVSDYLGLHLSLDVGDIIRTMRGVPIHSNAAFVAALQQLPVGKSEMIIERFGRPVTVELTREPPVELSTIKRISATRFDVPRATFDALRNDVRLLEQHVDSVPIVKEGAVLGIRVYNIKPDAACAVLGLQEYDILLEVEGRSVGSFDNLFTANHHVSTASQVTLRIERNGKRLAIIYVVP